MKRILFFVLMLLGITGSHEMAHASHGMGGEITWTCLANGQYKFRMKFYRDCNGITPSNQLQMQTNHPIGTITMNLVQQNDISPNGFQSNGTTPCFDCANGSFGNPIPGLVEEYVYESGNVTLAGVPPATGWWFRWGECCRSSALTNLAGAGGLGFANRAYMFPYNGQNANPCFDSSPYFSEKPSTIICTGFPYKYNPAAVDPELDSLVYGWANPIDDTGANIPFAPGYNVNSQLPSATQNPNNVAATIDPNTGEMSYTSFTGGYYVTVVKVTAYKCGIKVAEIYREINVVLNNNCPPVLGGVSNTPPDVNAPFFDPVTGLQTAYSDTFYAGDTVNFFLNATDFEFYNNGTGQLITIEAYGNELGVPVTNASAGCPITPCATLSTNTPFSFLIGGGVGFNWRLTCDHVKGKDTVCTRISNTYRFVIKASDNYCPANASNVSTINITVLAPPKLEAPVLRCASVNTDGGVSLSWTKPCPRDSQNIFHAYEIYAAQTAAGPYILVDSVKSWNTLTYTHTAANLNALFGTNAQQQSIWYYLKTRSGCDGDSISKPSDTLRTMYLTAVQNGALSVDLSWNPLRTPPLSSHATNKYKIYRQHPIPSPWVLVDSTAMGTNFYNDPYALQICDDFIAYRIDLADSSGCISQSSIDTVHALNLSPIVAISPANPVICQGTSTTLTATAGAVSYLWSTGAVTQSISVSNPGTYTVTANYGACQADTSVTLVVVPLPTPTITGATSSCGCVTVDAGPGYSAYAWSNGAVTQTTQMCTTGTFTVTVTNANGCTGTDTHSFTLSPSPAPTITGISTICAGTTTTLNAGAFTSYIWNTGATTQNISPGTAGTYTVTVTNGFGCTGTDTQILIVNPNPVPNITGTTAICAGGNTVFNAGGPYPGYQWNTGAITPTINISAAGTYTVTVTDANGCTGTDSQLLVVNTNPIPNITGNNVICDLQTTTFDAGAYSQYSWNTGATTQTITIGTAGTYTVTVTDANGCVGTDTYNLTVNLLPSATISGNQSICDGNATSFNITFGGPGPYSYTYSDGSVNYGPFNTGSGSATINVSPNVTTNYTLVSVINQNTLCVGTISGTAVVNVTPLPTATITGTTDICIGSSTNLQVAFTGVGPWTYTYTQNGSNVGPFTTSNNPEIIPVTPGGTTTYGLTATVTGAGCPGATNAATAVVTVNVLPTVTLTGNNTICAGETTDLTLNFTGTGPYTYSYSNGTSTFGPFTTSNDPETVTVTPGSSLTYTPVSISDANCTGTIAGSAAITVNPLPTAALAGTTSICDGADTDLTINFTGTGPFTYSYSDGSNTFGPFTTSSNPVSINVSPGVSTNYTPIAISDVNCTGSVLGSAVVTVIPLPTATMSGTTAICSGSSTNLNVVFTGVPPFEYKYTDGSTVFGPFTTNNFNVNIPVTPGITTAFSLTEVTGNGCGGSYTGVADITVNAIPDAALSLSGDPELCFGESSEFSISFTGVAPFTYSYSDGSTTYGPIVATGNPEIIPVTPGVTTSYSLISIDDANCPGTLSGAAQVVVHPLPTADATANLAICDGSSTSFSINFTGTGPYTYSYTDAGVTQGPFTTSNNPEVIIVSPTVNTAYAVTTISDAYCTGTATGAVNVTVNEIPTAAISGDAEICAGENTPLTIQFTGNAPFSYVYSNGITNFGPVTTSNNSVTFPVTPAASLTYTLISLNDANCPGTLSGSAAVVVNALPQPVISGDLSICDGETSTLSATSGFVSYQWSNGASANNISTGVGGPYTVTVVDGNGCSGTSPSATLVVNMVPVVSFTNDTSYSCETTSINFTSTGSYPAGSSFLWNFGDGTSSTLENPSHVYADSGVYQVSLVITTSATCFNDTTQTVEAFFYPLPVADFEASPWRTEVFNAKVLFTDLSENAVSWNWSFGDGNQSADQNPVHYFGDVGEFKVTLTVTNVTGCEDQITKEVVINPFYIPNAFTPNGDGNNEYFFDANTVAGGYNLDVQSFRITIFNRWGQAVYEADSYTKYWDGTDKDGNKVPEGVYVYKIEVTTKNSKKHLFNGTVTLLR